MKLISMKDRKITCGRTLVFDLCSSKTPPTTSPTKMFVRLFCTPEGLQSYTEKRLFMNSVKLVILLRSLYWSIHTKDERKRGTAFAFIFGVT